VRYVRGVSIRPARQTDRSAIAKICLLTGAAGEDATGHHSDATMLSDVYATPYLEGPGGFALVWDDGDGAVGYVLGASDTAAFQEWFTRTWWPSVADTHRGESSADGALRESATNPNRMLVDVLAEYPAHLHIDLLPQAQGKGAGRALIEAACALLSARLATGVHLEVDPKNAGALAFYPRVGFATQALRGDDGVGAFVRKLA